MLALGSRGDIVPYAALGRGLRAAGHQVRFITFAPFAPLITQQGLDFHPVEGDPQALVAMAGAKMLSLARTFSALSEGYARDLSAPQLGETDLIINQLPGGLYGYDLAEKAGIPMMMAAVIPLARTRTLPFMGLPRLPLPGYNRLTYSLGEFILWRMYRGTINRWRQEQLGLPALPARGYFHRAGTVEMPIMNGFSEHVVDRPDDWGPHIHVTGYWFPVEEEWTAPAGLQAFLEDGEPPVFIGFGSMPLADPQATTRLVLEALRLSGQRGIVHMGWGSLGAEQLPAEVYGLEYAPYRWLFPRLGLVIHHGGSGTTASALRAGVPSCAVPFVFDQHYWGARIAALGVSPPPVKFKHLTAEKLAERITQTMADERMRRQAAQLGARLQAEDGIGTAVALVEKYYQDRPGE